MRRHTACLLMSRRWVGSKGAYSWVGILSLLMSRPTTCLLRELYSRTYHRLGTELYWELFGRASKAYFECTCRVGPVQLVSFTTLCIRTKFGGLKVGGAASLLLQIFENFSSCSISQFLGFINMLTTLVLLLNPQTHFRSWWNTFFTTWNTWELFKLFIFASFWFLYVTGTPYITPQPQNPLFDSFVLSNCLSGFDQSGEENKLEKITSQYQTI